MPLYDCRRYDFFSDWEMVFACFSHSYASDDAAAAYIAEWPEGRGRGSLPEWECYFARGLSVTDLVCNLDGAVFELV